MYERLAAAVSAAMVLGLGLAACDKKKADKEDVGAKPGAPAAGGNAACDALGVKVTALAKADLDKMPPAMRTSMEPVLGKVGALFAKVCTEDKWGAEVIGCLETAAKAEECDPKLPAPSKARIERELKPMFDAAMQGAANAMANGAGGAPAGGAGPTAETLPECQAMLAKLDALLACPTIDPEYRDANSDAPSATRAALSTMSLDDPEQRASGVELCTKSAATYDEVAKERGCSI